MRFLIQHNPKNVIELDDEIFENDEEEMDEIANITGKIDDLPNLSAANSSIDDSTSKLQNEDDLVERKSRKRTWR